MNEKFKNKSLEHNLLTSVKNCVKAGDNILVGFSGGADSVALLFLLNSLKKEVGFKLTACHINHNLRGDESDRDEDFCRAFCKEKDIDLIVFSVDVKSEVASSGKSLEQAARDLRQQAFFEAKMQTGADKLFLGHHKNDQAETILFNIIRGTGVAGALGIKNTSQIFRPLLNFSKTEILDFVKTCKLEFVTDSTNLVCDTSRNLLRNKVVPMLEKICNKAVTNIANFAEILSEDEEYFNSILPLNLTVVTPNKIEIDKGVFKFEKPISIRTIKYCLNENGWAVDVFRANYEQILGLNDLKNGSKICLPHGLVAVREYEKIVIFKEIQKDKDVKKFDANSLGISEKSEVLKPFELGEFEFFGQKYVFKNIDEKDINFDSNDKFADIDKIPSSAVFRTRQNGDVFHKFNGGTKKLNDIFIDLKIPARLRDNIILLANGKNILWFSSVGISDDIKIDKNSKHFLNIKTYKV